MPYTNAPAELEFSSPKHEFERVFPGVYTGSVKLKNVSPNEVKAVVIGTTCFCLHIKSATKFARIAPGQSVEIPFAIDVAATGPYKQVLSATISGQKRLYMHPIYAMGIAPVAGINDSEIVLPELQRENIGKTSQTVTVTRPIETEVKALSISANAAWLRVKTRTAGSNVVLDAYAEPSAPDGSFSVPGRIEYSSKTRKISLDVTLSGRIVSQVTAEPALLSFGIAAQGKNAAAQKCVVRVAAALTAPATAACADPRVHARIVKQNANQITLEIGIDAGKSGEIDSVVHVSEKGKTLTDIPVSAFVSPG